MRRPRRPEDRPADESTSSARTRRLLTGLLAALLLLSLVATGGPAAANPDDPSIPTTAPPPVRCAAEALGHPFLIVKKSEYAALRARAERVPVVGHEEAGAGELRRTLLLLEGHDRRQRGPDPRHHGRLLLDVRPRPRSAVDVSEDRWRPIFNAWPAVLEQMEKEYPSSKNRWLQVVPPSSGYFNSVLALDVIHDDLPKSTLDQVRVGAEQRRGVVLAVRPRLGHGDVRGPCDLGNLPR